MACFRSTTSMLVGMCKVRHFSLMNMQFRTFSGFPKHILLQRNVPSPSLCAARNLSPSKSKSVANAIALCPPIFQKLADSNKTAAAASLKTIQTSREFHNSANLQSNEKPENKAPAFGEQMSLRLINENGFLSWTRNSYLSAAVGATMLNGANVDVVQHAGILVLVVSAMNMAWGSACHFTNLIRIRDRCAMSRPTLFLNLLGCVFHALLWLFILGYYIHFSGYTGWIRRRRYQRKENSSPVHRQE